MTTGGPDPYRRWRLAILLAVPLALTAALLIGYLLLASAIQDLFAGTGG